ncbi:MAG: putative Dynein heavy chain [Streblomastix strix]|uniref:Putative Dynein heavy chain n=1 Tax=Streblomastix strix TaxID=222440 RepID=A0A5J4WP79_9EUKA|nr:MAG: putative Dynein heavy chain [Streblomastix strix]
MPFVPYEEAPIYIPDCEARYNEDGIVHWEPYEIVGLQRIRDPSELKKENGIDEELKLEEEEEDDDDNLIEGDRQGSGIISVNGYNGSKKTQLPIHTPIKYITQLFEVQWGDHTRSISSKIHVMFIAEDLEQFAQRVLWPYQRRNDYALQMNHDLFQQSISTEDVELPSQKQLEYIMELSTLANTSPLHKAQDVTGRSGQRIVGQVKEQVTQMHCRAMNKLIFDQIRRDDTKAYMFEGIELYQLEESKAVIEQGAVQISFHNLGDAREELNKNSFFIKPQEVIALYHVRAECNRIIKLSLFCNRVLQKKTVRMEDLLAMYGQTCAALVTLLNEKWMASLKQGAINAQQSVGKGWFNLQEDNQYAIGDEVSKLKKQNMMKKQMHIEKNIMNIIRLIS